MPLTPASHLPRRMLRAALLLIALCAPLATVQAVGDSALAFQGSGADGKPVRFDPAARQRPAILLFWATWCPYCEALMPHVQRVLDSAGAAHLDVYAIDIKEDADPVKALRERKQSFTLIRDGDAIADQYGVKGTPALYLVDVHGHIVYRRVGGDAPEKVEAALREKLGLAPVTP